jgi:hypothetical protein
VVLQSWYRLGTPIERQVIEEGEVKLLRVEVYLLTLRIVLCDRHGAMKVQYSVSEPAAKH